MPKLALHILLWLLAVSFTRCGFPQLEKKAPGINEIEPNTKFTIVLPENHTTGYLWQLKQDYDESVIQQINEVWHGNEKGIYFNMKSLATGQTTLTFVSRKYQDTADIKYYIVKIGEN